MIDDITFFKCNTHLQGCHTIATINKQISTYVISNLMPVIITDFGIQMIVSQNVSLNNDCYLLFT